jgi:hypothetical protein
MSAEIPGMVAIHLALNREALRRAGGTGDEHVNVSIQIRGACQPYRTVNGHSLFV